MNHHGFSDGHAATLLRAWALSREPDAARLGLDTVLYRRWYAASRCRVALEPSWPPLEGMLRVAQVEALGFHPAVVVRSGAGGVAVGRDRLGRARALLRGAYAHAADTRAGLPPHVGEEILAVPRSGAVTSEGWWRTWGGGWDPRSAPERVLRLYLGAHVRELPALVGALTAALEQHAGPWMLKVTTHEDHLGRADAVVLYLRDRDAFDDVLRCSEGRVRPEPGPPLTEGLAPGVSWAEDPGDGRSFGESRCALVADACVRAEGRDNDAFLQEVRNVFLTAGLDPAAPHLRGGRNG